MPGILLIAIAAVAQGTAISVAMDMTEGIVARFRTMAISRAAVLTGHVGGGMVQTMLGLAVVTLRRRRDRLPARAGVAEWLAAAGVLAMIAFALTGSPSPWAWRRRIGRGGEQPADAPPPAAVPRQRLRPHRVDAAPGCSGSPSTSRSRRSSRRSAGLLMGTPIGTSAVATIVWCAVIALGGYLWARGLLRAPLRPLSRLAGQVGRACAAYIARAVG